MRAIKFPDWQDVLECDAALPASDRNSYKITIRWFLSYCRRVRRPANKEQAYAFMEEACERKQPGDWVLGKWKDGINWFFIHAPKEAAEDATDERSGQEWPRSVSAGAGAGGDSEMADPEICVPGGRGPERQPARLTQSEPDWRLKMVKGIRIRGFSYNTEKSYLSWLTRFARYCKHVDGSNKPTSPLDSLA